MLFKIVNELVDIPQSNIPTIVQYYLWLKTELLEATDKKIETLRANTIYANRFFYLAVNGIFAKIGRLASRGSYLANVQLIVHKCIPILLYWLDH